MMESLRQFWTARSLREQRMLLVMVALLAVTLFWLAVIRPLGDLTSTARARLDRATLDAGAIAARADSLRAARRLAPAATDRPLAAIVGEAAAAAGFELSQVAPQGNDRLDLTIAAARSPALFAWLDGLGRAGIFVERFEAHPGGESTLSVTLMLRARR